jgi:hypothetical protein
MAPQRLLAAAGSPLSRPGPLGTSASALALCSGLCHTSAPARLPGRRPRRHRTSRTPPASRAGTARAGADLALAARGRCVAGAAWGAVPRRRHDGGRTGGPAPLRASPTMAIARTLVGFLWAMATEVPVTPYRSQAMCHCTHKSDGFQCAWQEAPPRGGGTRDSVTRPSGRLVPSVRPAPDGGRAGGPQPTESRRSTRRLFLAPALAMHAGQKQHADVKKSGSHP